MFENPFSFEGRIRRTEYGLSIIIVACIASFISLLMEAAKEMGVVFVIVYIPIYWFHIAQGVKRSHDIGNSGWMLLVPIYGLYILCAEGDIGANEYGEDPKGRVRNVPSQPQNGFNQWQNNTSPKNTSGFGTQNISQQGNFYKGGRNTSSNTSQQGSLYNGGHNASPNTSQQGGFYNGGHNASPNTSQQGSFYNGGHNANQQSQKPTPPPNNSGDFNGDLYGKAK